MTPSPDALAKALLRQQSPPAWIDAVRQLAIAQMDAALAVANLKVAMDSGDKTRADDAFNRALDALNRAKGVLDGLE